MNITFPGLSNIMGATMAFSRGITPSVCQVRAVPTNGFANVPGTLSLIDDNGNFVNLPNCAVNTHSLRMAPHNPRQGWLWSIQIMDRRWAWRNQGISGEYNVRMPDNTIKYSPTLPKKRQNARELVELCLKAMGEQGYDCSAVPTGTYPYVNWVAATPAQQMQTLCDMFGLVVVYDYLSDTVRIWPLGQGDPLPFGPVDVNPTMPVQVSQRPDYLLFVCGPTRFQAKFKLEAVGLDFPDGKIKKINDLSYAPTTDKWKKDWYAAFPRVDKSKRHAAFETLFRWYRIKEMASGGLDVPGVDFKVKAIDQYVLDNVLVETAKDFDEMPQIRPPFIEGKFWPQCEYAKNTTKDKLYNGAFTILKDRNIIEFPYPIHQINTGGEYEEAELYLTTSFFLRLEDNSGFVSRTIRRDLPWAAVGAGPRLLRHPEVFAYRIQKYQDTTSLGGTTENTSEVDDEAKVYLDAVAASYEGGPQEDKSYAGLWPFGLDGARTQVLWHLGNGGKTTTRLGRNIEPDMMTTPYERRRREEKSDLVAERNLV